MSVVCEFTFCAFQNEVVVVVVEVNDVIGVAVLFVFEVIRKTPITPASKTFRVVVCASVLSASGVLCGASVPSAHGVLCGVCVHCVV